MNVGTRICKLHVMFKSHICIYIYTQTGTFTDATVLLPLFTLAGIVGFVELCLESSSVDFSPWNINIIEVSACVQIIPFRSTLSKIPVVERCTHILL